MLSSAISVGTSATKLYSGQTRQVLISPTNGDIYIGGPNVTTVNGIPVKSGGNLAVSIVGADEIYAICAAATVDTRVLQM